MNLNRIVHVPNLFRRFPEIHVGITLCNTSRPDRFSMLHIPTLTYRRNNLREVLNLLHIPEEVAIPTAFKHGELVLPVSWQNLVRAPDSTLHLAGPLAECDGLVTNDHLALVAMGADCCPLLVYDPVKGVTAATHVSMATLHKGIIGQTINVMVDYYGCQPANLWAYLGPGIGGCCFKYSLEGFDRLEEWWQRLTGSREPDTTLRSSINFSHYGEGGQWYFKFNAAAAWMLGRQGIPQAQVEVDGRCTACTMRRDGTPLFHSQRRDKGVVPDEVRGNAWFIIYRDSSAVAT